MRYNEFCRLNEIATSGSTSSGNVSTIIQSVPKQQSLGTGFDSTADHGIYQKSKRKPKTALIKRIPS